jgi:hypothetical protein
MKRKFSDRIGITKPIPIQLYDMNLSLRNSLWNLVLRTVFSGSSFDYDNARVQFITEFFLKVPRDEVPVGFYSQDWLKNKFYRKEFTWWHIYNLLEFLADHVNETMGQYSSDGFIIEANNILEEEVAGYRFINGVLSPITNPNEIGSIVDAIEISHAYNLYGAETHLNTALEKLSEKPKPDYRNSIKESISAIESLVKQITGEDSGGLDKAMSILDAKVKFHGAFKSGLLSLYGYTSDEDGIRHAILEEKDLDFDEAKFMLVACSALVNFIIAKASKHGLLPSI